MSKADTAVTDTPPSTRQLQLQLSGLPDGHVMFLTGARMRSTSANAAFSAAASAGLLGSTPRACSTACTLAWTTELLAMPTSVVDMLGFLHRAYKHSATQKQIRCLFLEACSMHTGATACVYNAAETS